MIVGVCSDKGSPGATTLSVALGLVWPGERLVVEADPSGGSLTFRMARSAGEPMLGPEPSVASLGAACRLGLPAGTVSRYTQTTMLGVPVIPGPLTAERLLPMRGLWALIGAELAGWSGTAVADLGRMQPGNAAAPLAQAATAVLLVGRGDVEGLYGLRERAADLAQLLGDPTRDRPSLAVVVTGPPRTRTEALRAAGEMLTAAGSPVPVAGFLADDPAGAKGLWAGQVTRKVAGSDLIRSATGIAETLIRWWPHLAGHHPVATEDAEAGAAGAADQQMPAGSASAGAAAGVRR